MNFTLDPKDAARRLPYLLALLAGCGSTGEWTVATYNLGLLSSVPYLEQRAPAAIDAAAKLDADLLCVQEVWTEEHWNALVTAQADTRPHVLRLDAEPGAVGKCDPDQFNPLESCAAQSCTDPGSLVSCVTSACTAQVAALPSTCTSCLLEHAGDGDFSAIRSACVGASAGSGERAYVSGGSYGIGLLSAKKPLETDVKKLDASTVRRAIFYARIREGKDDLHVFCTHLTAIQVGVRYEGSYGDWNGENKAHVAALIAWIEEKAGKDGKVVVLGDLNTGPAGDGIAASVPDSYAQLPAAGFRDPFLESSSAACTFCTDNALVSADDAAADAAIDHVLTRNMDDAPWVRRLFVDAPRVTVSTSEQDVQTAPLSDHYGLLARFHL